MVERVLIYNHQLTQSGGGERLTLEFFKHLRKKSEVWYVCHAVDHTVTFPGEYDDLPITVLPARNKLEKLVNLVKFVRSKKIDLIISPGTFSQDVDVFFTRLITGVSYISLVFGSMLQFSSGYSDLKYSPLLYFRYRKIMDLPGYDRGELCTFMKAWKSIANPKNTASAALKILALRCASRVYTLSSKNQVEIASVFGVAPRIFTPAISIMPSGCISYPRPSSHTIRLITVGRLESHKKIDILIRAVKALVDSGQPVQLKICGSGSARQELESFSTCLGLDDAVTFLGFVKGSDIEQHYQSADIFVNLDNADYDIAPIEALSRGLRIVIPKEFILGNLDDLPIVEKVNVTPDNVARGIKNLAARKSATIDSTVLNAFTYTYWADEIVKDAG